MTTVQNIYRIASLDGGDEALPVGPLGVAGEVAVEVHEDEEGVHGNVGVGIAALPDEAADGVEAPVGHGGGRILVDVVAAVLGVAGLVVESGEGVGDVAAEVDPV